MRQKGPARSVVWFTCSVRIVSVYIGLCISCARFRVGSVRSFYAAYPMNRSHISCVNCPVRRPTAHLAKSLSI